MVTDTNFSNFNKGDVIDEILFDEKKEYLYDFYPARLSKDSFPLKLWKRLFNKVIDDSLDFGAYSNGQGEVGLRTEIAKYLVASRGVKCNAKNIIICGGFSDSMELLAKILNKTHDTFAIENPGYFVGKKVFEEYGYKIKKINITNDGISIDELKKSKSKLVFTTPSHQFPTGVSMPISNRVKLLQWARENDAIIIEDDYDNRPIPSLQGLDAFDRVVYLGTFSKSLSPTLRASYMVLPNHLLPRYKELFDIYFPRVSLMIQKTLEKFMNEGHWEKHIRKVRTQNRKKHNLMKSLLIEKLKNTMKIESQGGGLSILINPTVEFDLVKLKQLSEEKKVKLYFSKYFCGGDWNAVRIGFGGFKEEEIAPAIELFSEIWYECLL